MQTPLLARTTPAAPVIGRRFFEYLGAVVLVLVVVLCTGGHAVAGSASMPEPFSAEYRVKYRFFEVGRYFLRLHTGDDGSYRYTSLAEPSSFISVFTGRQLKELSRGQWRCDGPEPLLYRRSVHKDDGWKDEEIRFDGEAAAELPADALDPASLVLALMHDAGQEQLRERYTLVDEDGDVRSYGIRDHGWVDVDADGEQWRARKLERQGGNPDYSLTVYLAPELGWLPVRIDYTDKGKAFSMYLVKVEGR